MISIQDDASHFLTDMIDLAETQQTLTHYFHVEYRQEVHRRKAFPVHLVFPDSAESQGLKTLINTWANTAEGQVFDGEGLRVAQIGRYSHIDGEHHQILNVPSIFNLPVTKDCNDNATATEQHSLIGLLCQCSQRSTSSLSSSTGACILDCG